jgi:hypothetical protein
MMVSATVVLTLIVVTGGCLAMATSAVPVANVANARRLQQQIPRNGVAVINTQQQLVLLQQQALAALLEDIIKQVQVLHQTQPQTLHCLRDPLNQVLHQLQPLVSTIRNQLREQSNDSSGGVTRNMRLQVQAAVGALTQLLTAMLGPQNVPAAVQAQLQSLRFAIASLKLISPGLFEGIPQTLLTITLKQRF